MTISGFYKKVLSQSKIEPAVIIKLVCFHLNISQETFWKEGKSFRISLIKRINLENSVKKLKRGMPLAYITGEKEFYSEIFKICRGVLIPRPETELLVELVLKSIHGREKILDIGAGSGVIGITLAMRSAAEVTLLEKYRKPLKNLKINTTIHNLGNRIRIEKGDLFPKQNNKFNIIVTNPPYISEDELKKVDRSVRCFEPSVALSGGSDGLVYIKQIVNLAPQYLIRGGELFMEIGYNQAKQTAQILKNRGFSDIEFFRDISGIERVAKGKFETTAG